MERKRQRDIALVALVVAMIAVLVWRASSTSPTSGAGTAANTSAAQATPQTRGKAGLAEVDLEALKAERPQPQDNDRDPFRFKPRPQPRPSAPSGGTASGGATRQPNEPALTGPAGPPPPPPIPLKFIGLASSKDDPRIGRLAILSDGRGVYYGREGEIIEGRYRILKIGVESIDLAYLDGRGRQTIRQTGQ